MSVIDGAFLSHLAASIVHICFKIVFSNLSKIKKNSNLFQHMDVRWLNSGRRNYTRRWYFDCLYLCHLTAKYASFWRGDRFGYNKSVTTYAHGRCCFGQCNVVRVRRSSLQTNNIRRNRNGLLSKSIHYQNLLMSKLIHGLF